MEVTSFGWKAPTLTPGGPGPFTPDYVFFGSALGGFDQDAAFRWDKTNDRLGIGGAPSYDLHVTKAAVGASVTGWIANTDNTNVASHANLTLAVGGAAGGNPTLTLAIPGGVTWTMYGENTINDEYRIASSSGGVRFRVEPTGSVLTVGDLLVGGGSGLTFANGIFAANTLGLRGGVADVAPNTAVAVRNLNALTAPGTKIIGFYSDNGVTERAYIDKDGAVWTADSFRTTSAGKIWKMYQVPADVNNTLAWDLDAARIVEINKNGYLLAQGSIWANGTLAAGGSGGNGTIYGSTWMGGAAATTLSVNGRAPDNGSGIAFKVGNQTLLTAAGGKIASFWDGMPDGSGGSTEQFYVDKDGAIWSASLTATRVPFVSATGTLTDSGSFLYVTGSGTLRATVYSQAGTGGAPVYLEGRGTPADAAAVAVALGNEVALTAVGAKIAAFYSDRFSAEKASIDKDGNIRAVGWIQAATTSNGAVYAGTFQAGTLPVTLTGGHTAAAGTRVGLQINSSTALTAAGDKLLTASDGLPGTERFYVAYNGALGFSATAVAANNAQTVTVGNVGPGGAGVSIQEWLTVITPGGTRYVPLFG